MAAIPMTATVAMLPMSRSPKLRKFPMSAKFPPIRLLMEFSGMERKGTEAKIFSILPKYFQLSQLFSPVNVSPSWISWLEVAVTPRYLLAPDGAE